MTMDSRHQPGIATAPLSEREGERERGGGREREGGGMEKERKREAGKETDRQTDRQTETKTEREWNKIGIAPCERER